MTIANVNVRQILLKRGNTTVSNSYTGPVGEVTIDTGLDTIRVHNGVTPGGTIIPTQANAYAYANLAAGNLQTQINTLTANAAVQQDLISNIVNGGSTFGNLLPSANVTYSLGNATAQWKDLYVSGDTIYIGGTALSVSNGNLLINGNAIQGGGNGNANTGDITFSATTISAPNGSSILLESKNFDGLANAKLTLDPDSAIAKLETITSDSTTFWDGDVYWATATWTVNFYGRGELVFTGAQQLYAFLDSTTNAWNSGSNERFGWNEGSMIPWRGYSYDGNGNLTIDLDTLLPPADPTQITDLRLEWDNVSRISVDSNDFSELQIQGRGISIEIDSTIDVNIEAGDDLRLTGTDYIGLRNRSTTSPVSIVADYDNNEYTWEFNADGSLRFPNNGSLRVGLVPVTSNGAFGDKQGTVAFDGTYIYYCIADYTDGLSNIWKRVAWSADTW